MKIISFTQDTDENAGALTTLNFETDISACFSNRNEFSNLLITLYSFTKWKLAFKMTDNRFAKTWRVTGVN